MPVGMVQLLTPEGERREDPDYPLEFEGDSADFLRGLLRDMILTRRLDTEATALQRHGELGLWPPLLGQEAAQIGAGRALRRQDMVFPTYREHGVAWCRGVDPVGLLGLFRGTGHCGWDAEALRFQPYAVVIGAQTLHAAGYAMGVAFEGDVGTGDPDRDTAVVAHFGDGASSQGDVSEAMVFAASFHAPVLFFCQNNQWAISVPSERQSRIPLSERGRGFGIPGVRVDGNDVLATYAVTKAALQRVRDGEGPMLIEAFTYRVGAHTTTDDPTRYRDAEEVEEWRRRDPIARLERHLRREGIVDSGWFDELDAEAEALGSRMRADCRALPDPSPLWPFEQVFVEMPEELTAQRDAHAAYLASLDASAEEVGA